ncbi:glycosyltransferase [uncultured Clostridium sp.]|nr:glycosyltransferase [uncultured Clostridium sp.]
MKSLLNQNYKNIETIVIDNDSTDNSVKIIEENFLDSIKLFRNKNTGYAD